ncbi:MAG: acyl-CoA dehydrogenase, partial [Actinobacteria bacterium]|nr:acyl-CoA dehydrogenase [Actinomycetota bacterium]
MVDTRISEEQQALRDEVARFAREVVAPVSAHHDETKTFPYSVVEGMAAMGLFGLPFPEEFGGMGGDYLTLCLAIEELARVDQSVAITLEAAVSLGAMPVYRFGSPEQKQRWLPELVAGARLGAFALTEAGSGSDAGAMRTSAVRDGDGWVINGTKEFITNCGTKITSVITVCAVTGRKPDGRPEFSSFLVPSDAPGLTVEPAYSKVGWHASDTHPLTFKDVRVGADAMLGEQGR